MTRAPRPGTVRPVPELLAPAGSLDAVRAAVANGADAVYLGAGRFNARDDGAQLSIDELATACAIARARGARVYLTLNVLVKPRELAEALALLGEAVDAGIDAVIVQDIGLVRLIREVYPELEIHGSTQMTVHDASGAAVVRSLGVERVVLARENTVGDVRAIRDAVPALGLEAFVHGALCIAYSGQCLMSGMISERSANRGSCAQSCRKDYVLRDAATGDELDRGYLISAKDLAAHDALPAMAAAGIVCLKVEGRKKKPEYVATVTKRYREFLDRMGEGIDAPAPSGEVDELVQIYSRGFTSGMIGSGRTGREYITRDHPDNRGLLLGTVVGMRDGAVLIDTRLPVFAGDGLGFEPPPGSAGAATGGTVASVSTLYERNGITRQAVVVRSRPARGWMVFRTADPALIERARASFAGVREQDRRSPMSARLFGGAGSPLKALFRVDGYDVAVASVTPLAPATKRALDDDTVRAQFGRLGGTAYTLANVDLSALAPGLFLPVSELNRMRQDAVAAFDAAFDALSATRLAERAARISGALGTVAVAMVTDTAPDRASANTFRLCADVFQLDDARAAARGGATEVAYDPFLRHPMPPVARVKALAGELHDAGVVLRLRTPTVLRPDERRFVAKWLDLDLPLLSGHLGLMREQAALGREVVADYAVNCFNEHTAATLFALGARRIVPSVELTVEELADVTAPWAGRNFDVVMYGRPEGMTIEHCVLSAAYDRKPTTCRDLCVKRHPYTELTDPAGYVFPVATDFACRNRLLHSRPIEASEFLPRLWTHGLRGVRLICNQPDDPVELLARRWRAALDALAAGTDPALTSIRSATGGVFTRGHFSRAV